MPDAVGRGASCDRTIDGDEDVVRHGERAFLPNGQMRKSIAHPCAFSAQISSSTRIITLPIVARTKKENPCIMQGLSLEHDTAHIIGRGHLIVTATVATEINATGTHF